MGRRFKNYATIQLLLVILATLLVLIAILDGAYSPLSDLAFWAYTIFMFLLYTLILCCNDLSEREDTEQIIIRNVMYREVILAIQCARIAKAASEENWFDWIETWDDGTLMESIPEDITAQEWFDKQYPIIQSLLKETMEDI